MGIPILTSEGFVGQRWIIDDYFQAGETLHAGDVVGIKKDLAARGGHPRVFKVDSSNKFRVIGIVHTPAAKAVGDEMARTGATASADGFVPVVVKGVAKALTAGSIGVGDPVMASGTSASPTGKTTSVATVVGSNYHEHSPNSPADGRTGAEGAHSHTTSTSTSPPTL